MVEFDEVSPMSGPDDDTDELGGSAPAVRDPELEEASTSFLPPELAKGLALPSPKSDEVGLAAMRDEVFGALFDTQRSLGRFRVIREVGRGGMGVVYEAEQDLPHRRVALKTLPSNPSAVALSQFRVEVNATARVVHPGIPQVFEVFEVGGVPVLAMEFVEGQPLLEAVRGTSLRERVRVIRDICLAVQAAHARGVIHRDLKPSNVLLGHDGQAKVLDFGIAALGGDDLRGSFTPSYAAPEQLRGEASDVGCDVYGIGALALEVLAGRHVVDIRGKSLQEVIEHKSRPITLPSDLPSALASILVKALSPVVIDRYPSAATLAEDLDRYLHWQPVHAFEGGGDTAPGLGERFTVTHEPGESSLGGQRFSVLDTRGEVVAAVRLAPLGPEPDAESVDWLGVALSPELAAKSWVLEELWLDEGVRGTDAVEALFVAAYRAELGAGSLLTFMATAPIHYLQQLRMGFRPVGRISRVDDGYVVPMVRVNHDLEYLLRMGSPLTSALRAYGNFGDIRGVEWMRTMVAAGELEPPTLASSVDDELDSVLFEHISPEGRRELLLNAKRLVGSPGDTLIDEGARGDWMALVESGLVEIIVSGEVVAVRGMGDLVGEMGLLLDKPRTARVTVAVPETTVLVLSPESISQLSRPRDRERLWRNLAAMLAHKLEGQTQRSSHRVR